ncbi:LysR family transcriptional regulator [Actinoplanes sp. NPDC051851]|uniref:LysR family transcriptional regulator n=1 Tax=Actinoplanes sp. NPDC051851 TaxID=3154753 RepID=UPI003434BBF8
MTVELRHLRAFLAIADEGGITRAAARLHMTQPALSRTLRQLEEHLGVRLVDRSTHHLRLTEAGAAYRSRAAAAVAAVDDVLDPARAGTSPLRFGHAWGALGEHTPVLLRTWRDRYPTVPLEMLRVDDRTAGLAQGSVDVALIRGPVDELPGVRAELLLAEPRVAALPSDNPLAEKDRLTLDDLTGETICVNTVAGITTLGLWPPGAAPTRTVEVTNTDDWLSAVTAGRAIGVTVVSTVVMYANPAVRYIPLTGAPPVPVHLAWREPLSHPAVPSLVALAREVTAR